MQQAAVTERKPATVVWGNLRDVADNGKAGDSFPGFSCSIRRSETETKDMSDRTKPDLPPAKAAVAKSPGPDAAQGMTLFVTIVATLYFGKEVLVPVTLALLLAFILAPLVDLLRRIHLGRVPSVLLGVALALGVVLAIGGVIGTEISELSTGLPKYAATVEAKVAAVKSYTVGRLSKLAEKVGQHGGEATPTDAGQQPQAPAAHQQAAGPGVPQAGSATLDTAERYLSPILSPLATFGIVFVVTVFALLQREDLRDRLIRLIGSDDLHRTTLAIDDGARRLSKYFLAQLSVNTAFGIVIGIGLFFIGVPNPVLWGILSALLRFVPYVGSFIAAVLPMGLAAAVEPGWSMVAWTAALYAVAEGLTGQVIEPLLYGHSTGLSPFSVIVAALFWSWLWGPIGLILSTPLTLCLVVMGRHVKRLEFLDVALGDRPPLTPVESFYQRILAGDADEAHGQAEELLKDHALATYYDEVALAGLQLATADAVRGALDDEQLDRVKDTIRELVHALADHDDTQPPAPPPDADSVLPPEAGEEVRRTDPPHDLGPPFDGVPEAWRSPSAVLCIAGRGPLDDAAAAMLAQLLGKHAMGARVVSYGDVSWQGVETLDVSGVAMVCVSYLDITGTPAHLRYLIQRLRRRLPPGTPILIGLWPADDLAAKDDQARAGLGADFYTSTLTQTVDACIDAARNPPASGIAA